MKCGGLDGLSVKQLGTDGVKHGVPHLMTCNIGAFSRKESPPGHALMEEMQTRGLSEAATSVEGVQVHAVIENNGEACTHFPSRSLRHDRSPEIGRAPQSAGRGVEPEVRRARLIYFRRGRRSADSEGEWLSRLVRNRHRDWHKGRLKMGIARVILPCGDRGLTRPGCGFGRLGGNSFPCSSFSRWHGDTSSSQAESHGPR